MPSNDSEHVKGIVSNHCAALPESQLPISQKPHGEGDRDDKEANVSSICTAVHPELSDQGHGACNHACDEAGGANEFTNSHACAVGPHCCKSTKDIGRAVSKCQKRDARETLAEAQDGGDGAQVDTEEVTRRNADGGEQQPQPGNKNDESSRLRFAQVAVVQSQVGKKPGIFIYTVLSDKSALVLGRVHFATFRLVVGASKQRRGIIAKAMAMSRMRQERVRG
jgi:hypothetical protein